MQLRAAAARHGCRRVAVGIGRRRSGCSLERVSANADLMFPCWESHNGTLGQRVPQAYTQAGREFLTCRSSLHAEQQASQPRIGGLRGSARLSQYGSTFPGLQDISVGIPKLVLAARICKVGCYGRTAGTSRPIPRRRDDGPRQGSRGQPQPHGCGFFCYGRTAAARAPSGLGSE